MSEKKMTLDELVRWLDDNDVSYEIGDAGRLTVKGSLQGHFRDWVGTCKYTGLPDELVRVDRDLWLERTSIMSLGGLTSVGGWLDLRDTSITSLGNLTSVGGSLNLEGATTTSLDNLTSVGEGLFLEGVPITSWGNLTSVGEDLDLQGASVTSLDDLPQVGNELCLDQSQFQLITRGVLQKVKGGIRHRDQGDWFWGIILSPDELETIIAENERRERLHNTRGNLLSDVDWALYDK